MWLTSLPLLLRCWRGAGWAFLGRRWRARFWGRFRRKLRRMWLTSIPILLRCWRDAMLGWIWTLGFRSKFDRPICQISGKLVYSTARVLAFLGISRLG